MFHTLYTLIQYLHKCIEATLGRVQIAGNARVVHLDGELLLVRRQRHFMTISIRRTVSEFYQKRYAHTMLHTHHRVSLNEQCIAERFSYPTAGSTLQNVSFHRTQMRSTVHVRAQPQSNTWVRVVISQTAILPQ